MSSVGSYSPQSPMSQTPYSSPSQASAVPYSSPLASQNAATLAQPTPKSGKDRPFSVTLGKMAAEMGVGFGGFYWGKQLGTKYLTKLGEKAAVTGGAAGFIVGGALTGAIFSGTYQKLKTGTIDRATFIKDTLLGAIGC